MVAKTDKRGTKDPRCRCLGRGDRSLWRALRSVGAGSRGGGDLTHRPENRLGRVDG